MPGVVLGAAALTIGLIAGLFYAYVVSVMPGLDRGDDRTLVDGMQQINEAIENSVFFLSFLGAPMLTALGPAAGRGPSSGAARPVARSARRK